MRLSLEADYALRITGFLAELGEGEVCPSTTIARECCLTEKFSLKVLSKLRKAGIVNASRGVNGGYSIARAPKDITYLEVINCIEGPIKINKCLIRKDFCKMNGNSCCTVRDRLLKINHKVEEMLGDYTFE